MFIFLYVLTFSCDNNETVIVVNSDDEDKYLELMKLKLDDAYNNLLDSKLSTENEYKEVLKSWGSFHQQVGEIVKEHKFDWGVKDSLILVMNKVYFNKKGKVAYYLFKVKNESVSKSKKVEYEKLLLENISKIKIDLKRENKFSQCGKSKYLNI